jgi:hypothetical protein
LSRRLLHFVAEHPPPGPTRRDFWRSPLRGPWLTSILGSVLLAGITIVFVTGLLSYAAYNPDLGDNDTKSDVGLLRSTSSTGRPIHRGSTGSLKAPTCLSGSC